MPNATLLLELFWTWVYNGSLRIDSEMLDWRGHALEEYLQSRDEDEGKSFQDEDGTGAIPPWEQGRRRSSAVSGINDLALE
jgi:hypothetical protein